MPKNTPFRNKKEEIKFHHGFLSLMEKYYEENNLKNPDLLEINWDDLNTLKNILEEHNNSVDFALGQLQKQIEEEEDNEAEREAQEVIIQWIGAGLLSHCKKYDINNLEQARTEYLGDSLKQTRNKIGKQELFQWKRIETLYKNYRKK